MRIYDGEKKQGKSSNFEMKTKRTSFMKRPIEKVESSA